MAVAVICCVCPAARVKLLGLKAMLPITAVEEVKVSDALLAP